MTLLCHDINLECTRMQGMADWALAAAGGRVIRTSHLIQPPRARGPLSWLAATLFGTGSMAAAKQVRA